MKPRIYHLKVYTIEIKPSSNHCSRLWYYKRIGELFNAVLVTKETGAGFASARFLLIKKTKTGFEPPTCFLTVRPEDCTVFHEQVIKPNNSLSAFLRSFSIESKPQPL